MKTVMSSAKCSFGVGVVLRGLQVGYAGRVVAGPLSGELPAGTLTCLLGRNGTGKSTLLRTLAGVQPSLGGTLAFTGLSAGHASPARQRQVGIVLTQRLEGVRLTVGQTVALGRMPYTGFMGRLTVHDREVVRWAMEQTSTLPLAQRPVETLSDGEWQRVMLARVLAQQTPVVLADEVTAFLDYPSKREVMRLLGRVAHSLGLTVLLSTHDVPLALAEADRLWLLERGAGGAASCLSSGLVSELKESVEHSFV